MSFPAPGVKQPGTKLLKSQARVILPFSDFYPVRAMVKLTWEKRCGCQGAGNLHLDSSQSEPGTLCSLVSSSNYGQGVCLAPP